MLDLRSGFVGTDALGALIRILATVKKAGGDLRLSNANRHDFGEDAGGSKVNASVRFPGGSNGKLLIRTAVDCAEVLPNLTEVAMITLPLFPSIGRRGFLCHTDWNRL